MRQLVRGQEAIIIIFSISRKQEQEEIIIKDSKK